MADHSYHEKVTAKVELNLRDWEAKMLAADLAVDSFAAGTSYKKTGSTGSFQVVGMEIVRAAVTALNKFANDVMEDSLEEVPKDTMVLANSAATFDAERKGNRIVVEMGYGYGDEINPKTKRMADQYALPVHEIFYAEHDPPTKSHYLIDPLLDNARRFQADIVIAMKSVTEGGRSYTLIRGGPRGVGLEHDYAGVPTNVPAIGGGKMFRGKPGNAGQFAGAL